MKLNFTKGINTKEEPVNTPVGFYRDAVNMCKNGTSLKSEEGTLDVEGVPSSIIVWGTCSIENTTVVLGSDGSSSVIGRIEKTEDSKDKWIEILSLDGSEDCFNFMDFLQVEGRVNWKGDHIIYFSSGRGRVVNLSELSSMTPEQICEETKLFTEHKTPIAEYKETVETGSVPTGIYQFFVRVSTEEGKVTSFGFPTGMVPVVDDSLTSSQDIIDGAPPQTEADKAITIKIKNLDTTYDYYEVAVLTYVGDANIPKVYLMPKETIIEGEEEFTFLASTSQLATEISVEELLISSEIWLGFGYIAQKDNSLILGAPTPQEFVDVNWFEVAKNIVIKPTIKRLKYSQADLEFKITQWRTDPRIASGVIEESENLTDQPYGYKDPENTVKYKGYRRGEVYVFTLTPIFKTGGTGPTVIIPADITNPEYGSQDKMGWFQSSYKYPEGMFDGLDNEPLRLHRFPRGFGDDGIPVVVEEDGVQYIQALGIEVSNIKLSEEEEEKFGKDIDGYIIGRVDRTGNESLLAQGIARPCTEVYFSDNMNEQPTKESYIWPTVGLADTYGVTENLVKEDFRQYYFTRAVNEKEVRDCRDFKNISFIAPDIVDGTHDKTFIKAFSMANVQDIKQERKTFRHDNDEYIKDVAIVCGAFDESRGVKPSSTLNDTSIISVAGPGLEIEPTGVFAEREKTGGQITYKFRNGIGPELHVGATNGFVWFTLDDEVKAVPFRKEDTEDEHLILPKLYVSSLDIFGRYLGWMAHNLVWDDNYETPIYNSMRLDEGQYGPIESMTSMYVGLVEKEGTVKLFNGDTFISKYAYSLMDENAWENFGTSGTYDYIQQLASGRVAWLWLESNNNYEYRHSIVGDEEETSAVYYPKEKQIINKGKLPVGVVSYSAENTVLPGYPSQYNKQYSAQSNLKPYVVTPLEDINNVASYGNRILYSAVSVEGEKKDSYLVFKPNDYYDVPRTYGDLSNIFVSQGELYASTSQIMWRLFFNTMASQTTTAGEVVLGTGGAFNRPAVPASTVTGGFAGCSNWTHMVNTQDGIIYVDKVSGSIYFLDKTSIGDVSVMMHDNFRHYIKLLKSDYLSFPEDDIKLGLDLIKNRVFVRIGVFMYSVDLGAKTILSRHSYLPRYMFNHGSQMYSNKLDNGIVAHSIGKDCLFYNTPAEASITLVANEGNSVSKLFNVIEIIANKYKDVDIYDRNNLNVIKSIIPFEHFDQYEVHNMERYTGKVDINHRTNMMQIPGVLEVLVDKVKDSYRMPILGDIVKDPKNYILDEANHVQVKTDTEKVKWLPRIRGTYIELKLTKFAEDIDKEDRGSVELISAQIDTKNNTR